MDRPTVLLVTPESTRALDVDISQLARVRPLRRAVYGLSALLALVLAALGAMAVQRHTDSGALQQAQALQAREKDLQAREQAIEALRQEAAQLKQAASAEIDAKLATLQKSEQMIGELQAYLKARGVNVKPASVEPPRGHPNAAAGGPQRYAAARPAPGGDGSNFARAASNLLDALQSVPLGLPHDGPLSSRFGLRSNPFTGKGSEFHGGLDFKGATGDPIGATANGKVSFAGTQNGYGKVVVVEHAHGYSTLYAHLSRIDVKPGQRLRAGDTVGLLGNTGRSTGPHLHYEVQLRGERLDPERFLSLHAAASSQPVAAAPAHALP